MLPDFSICRPPGRCFPRSPLLPVAHRFRLPSIDIRFHYSNPITAFV
ncbi:MAG: hypothetical protein KatS3mg050_3674 [Litorilinea sp.]|nr:MAG: hypothetical protein KatS3mg050_3674 [Litorilinea sp.]